MQASFRNVTLFWVRELLKNGQRVNVKVHDDLNLFNFAVLIYKIWKKILHLPCFCASSSSEDPRIAFTPNLRKGEFDGFCRVPSPGDFGWGGKTGLPRGNCRDNNEWFLSLSKFSTRNEGEGPGWPIPCVQSKFAAERK